MDFFTSVNRVDAVIGNDGIICLKLLSFRERRAPWNRVYLINYAVGALFKRAIHTVDNDGNAVVSTAGKRNDQDTFAKLGKHCAIHVSYVS